MTNAIKFARFLAIALLSACIASCAADPEPAEVSVGVAQQALWSSMSVGYWPNGTIDVCFEPSAEGAQNTQRYMDMTARVRAVAEQAYETLPGIGITLNGWARCSNREIGSLPGKLRVVISSNANVGCWSGPGTGNWTTRHCPLGAPYPGAGSPCAGGAGYLSNMESVIFICGNQNVYDGFPSRKWDAVVMHEFMHVIAGAGHEMDRTDNDGSVQTCLGNGGGTPDNRQFTSYDPASITITSYCEPHEPVLSSKDILALETIYPTTFSRPARGWNSLTWENGIVIRSDSTIVDDWTYRGGTTEVYAGNIGWARNGTLFTISYSLPASSYPGTNTFSGTFSDFRGRTQTISSTSITVSSELHTALMLSVL